MSRNHAIAAVLVVLWGGCVRPHDLHLRANAIQAVTERARRQGAYRCAPEELALATGHLELAAHELEEGDPPRAGEHLTLAELNARAALRLSDDAACLALPPTNVPEHHDAQWWRFPHAPPPLAAPRRDHDGSTARTRSRQSHAFF